MKQIKTVELKQKQNKKYKKLKKFIIKWKCPREVYVKDIEKWEFIIKSDFFL